MRAVPIVLVVRLLAHSASDVREIRRRECDARRRRFASTPRFCPSLVLRNGRNAKRTPAKVSVRVAKSLCFLASFQSGRPDSNRRRPAWEAGILPTELRPQTDQHRAIYVSVIASRYPVLHSASPYPGAVSGVTEKTTGAQVSARRPLRTASE